jgi:hypothetical protein
VVSENDYRVRVSSKKVSPSFGRTNDGEEFTIVDLIVTLCWSQTLGEVATGVVDSIFIGLEEDASGSNLGGVGGNSELPRGIRVSEDRFG